MSLYESRRKPPLSHAAFARRMAQHIGILFVLVLASLALGMIGYAWTDHLPWIDAFLNAAMLLGGMGPVDFPKTDGGKLFAGLYALYAGLVFLLGMGIVIAPIAHRVLHKFHWDEGGKGS